MRRKLRRRRKLALNLGPNGQNPEIIGKRGRGIPSIRVDSCRRGVGVGVKSAPLADWAAQGGTRAFRRTAPQFPHLPNLIRVRIVGPPNFYHGAAEISPFNTGHRTVRTYDTLTYRRIEFRPSIFGGWQSDESLFRPT